MLRGTGSILLCALLAATISPILSRYVIDVKLLRFENPSGVLANGNPCSPYGNPCSTSIDICATFYGNSISCAYGKQDTGVLGSNIINLNHTSV
ncbi:hypothetical protein Ahia01_000627600, partial [Argonauta hians]